MYTPQYVNASEEIDESPAMVLPQQICSLNQIGSPKPAHNRNNSRDSPDLAKCSQIVQTINTLN